jgi:hypothetical protein
MDSFSELFNEDIWDNTRMYVKDNNIIFVGEKR